MAKLTLADMISTAAAADGPSAVRELTVAHSAIDPCGLRETNFDMMDLVADGLNNVARHIRPFTLVAWAWRRGLKLSEGLGKPDTLALEDFVARIEVIFAWSSFLAKPNAELPGRQALSPIIGASEYTFGGSKWHDFNKVRRNSTALSAPINYGPGLRSMGWLARNAVDARVQVPCSAAEAALDAFEARISDRLDHPAFSVFGTVTVTADEARAWAEGWSIDSLTDEERRFAARSLYGDLATPSRGKGIGYLLRAANAVGDTHVSEVRKALSGEMDGFAPDSDTLEVAGRWKALQHRQLFRLAVESLLAWILDKLSDGPMETGELAGRFLAEAGVDPDMAAGEGLLDAVHRDEPISGAVQAITSALAHPHRAGLATAVARALALSIANAPDKQQSYDRDDRLPLAKAARQANARRDEAAASLARHAIEAWALAQHVYWAIGRGLQDARRGGKTILRLKVVVDEGGWTVLPGRGRLSPNPTPDRIQTALSLAAECKGM